MRWHFTLPLSPGVLQNKEIILADLESDCFQILWGNYLDSLSYYELFFAVELHRGTNIHESEKAKRGKKTLAMALTNPYCTIGTNIETRMCMSLHWPISQGTTERTRKHEFFLAPSLRWKLGQKRLHWVGAGLLLSQDLTLLEEI